MIERRTFLFAGALSVVAAGGAVYLTRTAQSQQQQLPVSADGPEGLGFSSGLGRSFDDLLKSLQGTDAIGQAWVNAFYDGREAALIASFEPMVEEVSSGQLLDEVVALIRSDFRSKRLCQVDGWMLSQTECELAGLRHLLVSRSERDRELVARETTTGADDGFIDGHIVELQNWGPRTTPVGQPFNVQLDGHSGLWFVMPGAPAHVQIEFDGQLMKTSVSPKVVTSGLFGEQQNKWLATAGRYQVALVDPVRRIRQPIGEFVVGKPDKLEPAQQMFCEITNWGPRKTSVGVIANQQPDGSLGLWVKSSCFPSDARLLVGDDVIRSGLRSSSLMTGSIPPALLERPGKVPISIHSEKLGQSLPVGELTIVD